MAERVIGERDLMPDPNVVVDLIRIDAGEKLDVLFRPAWVDKDGVERRSIHAALKGNPRTAWRGDGFSKDRHHHVAPVAGAQDQIPITVVAGQTPLESVLDIFRNGDRFRGILVDAEQDDHAGEGVTDEDLARAAAQIVAEDAERPLAA